MTIEYVTKEKVQSLHYMIPGLLGKLALAPEEAQFVLISDEKLLKTIFSVAIVLDGEVFYLSNDDYLEALEAFLS
ncbi:MAG: hypothetical protein KBS81_11700 [Spirochaetales bacterium]|nr:hypothetical protein [Candidatus Physcosoma equi]